MAAAGSIPGLPLRPGDGGEAVRDVQQRLAAVGFGTPADELATYGAATTAAVESFQRARGLRVDGICGRQTWSALVEAGYRLGDRLLYLRSPMLRGDDVADLQRRLGALGFDAGRVDGILGERTATALEDFQRNAGLTPDRICGPATLAAFERLGARTAGDAVAGVRERDALRRSPPTLERRRVVVTETGPLASVADALARSLRTLGADVITLRDADDSVVATDANRFAADVFIALGVDQDGCGAAYYGTAGFESPGGRRLATLLAAHVPGAIGALPCQPRAMAVPLLRETRMPAVLCDVGPPEVVVTHEGELVRAIADAVIAWAEAPAEDEVHGSAQP